MSAILRTASAVAVVSSLGAVLLPALAATADDARQAKRFKGMELYSWQDGDKNWNFVLADGTNRRKTVDEIKKSPNRIAGVEGLKKALVGLAEGEEVIWTGDGDGTFTLPDVKTVDDVEKAGKKAGVKVTVYRGE